MYDENVKRSGMRPDCHGETVEWGRAGEEKDYGHGDYQRGGRVHEEGGAARRPIEVRVRGYELSLRKRDAEMIEVE